MANIHIYLDRPSHRTADARFTHTLDSVVRAHRALDAGDVIDEGQAGDIGFKIAKKLKGTESVADIKALLVAASNGKRWTGGLLNIMASQMARDYGKMSGQNRWG
jgi:hypothetical protein